MVRSLSEFDFVDATKPATPLEVNDDSDYDKDEIINDAKLTTYSPSLRTPTGGNMDTKDDEISPIIPYIGVNLDVKIDVVDIVDQPDPQNSQMVQVGLSKTNKDDIQPESEE